MKLSGPQLKQLQEALIDAFPTWQDLSMMVRHGLGEHLPVIAKDGNLQHMVFELLQWAQAQGRLEELIKAALAHNRGNLQLKSVAAILRVSSGQSASAIPPATTLPRIWNIPYPRNPFFTGQEELLEELAEALSKKRRASLSQGITGLGGIGKTQIAVEYAHRHQQEYQAVLWVLAETHESLVSSYLAIAQLLNLPQMGEQDQTVIVQAVKSWLQTTHNSWLLVFDNAHDVSLVSEFLPSRFDGQILLTTRAQSMGGLAECIEVKTMSLDVGALLLLRRARLVKADACLSDAMDADVVTAKTICEELGGLPLALDQAGAYLEETQCNLGSYLASYRKRRTYLLSRRGSVTSNHPDSVAVTWSLAFEKVEQQSIASADLLRVCAFLAPDAIPEEIIKQGAGHLSSSLAQVTEDDGALDEAMAPLLAYSLVRRDRETKTLSVHRLVQAVLKDSMDEQTRRHWAEQVVLVVSTVFPHVEFETWLQCESCLPHALVCAELVEHYQIKSEDAARLLNEAGYYLEERARYAEAEVLLKQALLICEQQLRPRHPYMAIGLNNLAFLYYNQGKYGQAEPLYRRALAIFEATLGPENPHTVRCLNDLALLYSHQGEQKQAKPLYERVLAIRERQLGPEHPHTALSLNNLAEISRVQGEYERAESLYKRALAICEKQLEPEHPDTACGLNNLAVLYQEMGKYEQAKPLHERALAICEKQLGPEHPHTVECLNNLARLYDNQGKYDLAEPLCKRVLAIFEATLGPEHPSTALGLNNLAVLYRIQGKHEQAKPLHERALMIREQQLGPMHPDTAQSLGNLANLYSDQREYSEAELLYKRALAIQERQFGPVHPDTALSLNNLAALYRAQAKYKQAEPLYKRALRICERQLGETHPDTVICLDNLASLYKSQGKYEQAESLYLRTLSIYEQQLGETHPDTQASLNNLAELYKNQRKYEKAKPFYVRLLTIREQQLGEMHLSTATSLSSLAHLYSQQGNYTEAESLYKRALSIYEQQLGEMHFWTATSLSNLAVLSYAQSKYSEAEPLFERALLICEQVLGETHPDTQAVRQWYIRLLKAMGRNEEAARLSNGASNERATEA